MYRAVEEPAFLKARFAHNNFDIFKLNSFNYALDAGDPEVFGA
jgi:hypothetical protein